ncbi:MerR family transcriptional regulator [Nocardia farcinica]|nr:MerR family transcriptional regulator [Nocardia farcinica]
MQSRNSGPMRTVTVARRSGYSVQQIRNLEGDGVLPPAARTDSGYRVYDDRHVRAARAYRALAAAVGPVEAKTIMRTVHAAPVAEALARLDAAHADLDRQRRDLRAAEAAAHAIADEPLTAVRPADAMTVSELADALGIRASTLRHWDAEGLVVPGRAGGARRYSPTDVRDARIVHQLRRAGHRIDDLRTLLPHFRGARRHEVLAALAARGETLTRRSRALLTAAAELDGLLAEAEPAAGPGRLTARN